MISKLVINLPSVIVPTSQENKSVRMPELLVSQKSSLEIEMDRFLARKHMPFKIEQSDSVTIVCLMLKSWYTLVRQN